MYFCLRKFFLWVHEKNEKNFCCYLTYFTYLFCWIMIKKQSQVSPAQLELHSPFQANENSSEIEKDWVKETEDQIESLQTRTSAVLQSLNFISWNLFIFWNIYFVTEFAENYEALWEQFCEKISELNEQNVTSIAQTVGDTAKLEEESKILQEELAHTQTMTSSLASKLLPEP